MTTADLGFIHRFVPATAPDTPLTLLLLHGTGGSENDLLKFGRTIHPTAALLSPRGKILENSQPRFFRRFAEGVFDEDDIRLRANELADFVEVATAAHNLDPHCVVAVGYSNGANMATATLLLRPKSLAGAILLRPMVPLRPQPLPNLRGKPVLIEAGRTDVISPPDQTAQLAGMLQAAGAQMAVFWHETGHNLTNSDAPIAQRWLVTSLAIPTTNIHATTTR
jgi:predicted esterase